MAKFIFGMNLSLDGYVDHQKFATLVADDIEAAIRNLKSRLTGEIAVAAPELAQSLSGFGLVDEYRLYFRPVVLGRGTPFFAGPRPPLHYVSTDLIGEDTVRLIYAPA
jgi:dihydrofolate reductase